MLEEKHIYGKEVDEKGRCAHYHQSNDIAGLKCESCQKYFACYQCHDELMEHLFEPCSKNDSPVICGECKNQLNFDNYARGYCPYCQTAFNPNCHLHWNLYFK
ncbi:CHY zinc finger protein [Lactococcus nasutitermitis]|uniref:CHY zinc finger protein n=1 Tax=Lactococcus nasutitermitis TaxID=1652957 RepID=A0ABV9JD63_9LACT|nr:CHY zinc finger protein [Lactococcus nasutitermitis]